MELKEEFLDLLCNPSKTRGVSKEQFEIYNRVIPTFLEYFKHVDEDKRMVWAIEASSYLFGKAMEITVLGNIRPEEKAVWIVPQEVEEGITFDLPKHIEDRVIDLMDPFESAVEEYVKTNYDVDFTKLWVFSEHLGVIYALQNKLSDVVVGGITNDKVLTNNELYRFGMNAFSQEIQKYGFSVKSISGNLVDFANAILEKDGKNYLVAASVTILPKEGYIADWRINKLKEEAKRLSVIPATTHIGLIPSDELYASMGIAIKEGQYKVQVRKLVNVLTNEVIE